jgi:hypothetical protein
LCQTIASVVFIGEWPDLHFSGHCLSPISSCDAANSLLNNPISAGNAMSGRPTGGLMGNPGIDDGWAFSLHRVVLEPTRRGRQHNSGGAGFGQMPGAVKSGKPRVQSQKAGWQNRTAFQHRRCLGVRSFSFPRSRDFQPAATASRHGGMAIYCQEEAESMALSPAPALKRRTTRRS